ncbi:MAG: hypothetical protein ACOX6W_08200 [Lentisphaeria bacterium]|jgi:hypothetical protein|nr:hypothetical protein [Bacteroidales bacterium]
MKSKSPILSPKEELAAWNAWKEICFIDGCPPEQRDYLRRRVIFRINEELQKYYPGEQWNSRISPNEMIIEFDLFLAYKNGLPAESGISKKPRHHFKRHKDFIWYKLNCSSDPPMQVLNGILLGSKGKIMDVVRKLLKTYYQIREERVPHAKSGKTVRRLIRTESLHEPLQENEGNSYTLEERIASAQAAPDELAAQNLEDMRNALSRLVATLTKEGKLVLLAKLLMINASEPSLARALGRGKSTAYALLKQVQEKVQRWYLNNDDVPKIVTVEAHQIFCELLIAALQQNASPEAQNFLHKVQKIRAGASC